jgi:hypothetical protein
MFKAIGILLLALFFGWVFGKIIGFLFWFSIGVLIYQVGKKIIGKSWKQSHQPPTPEPPAQEPPPQEPPAPPATPQV